MLKHFEAIKLNLCIFKLVSKLNEQFGVET